MSLTHGLTAVPGLTVGHWTHPAATTGATVVRCDTGAVGGVWVPGSASGSRELGALALDHLAGAVHAVCLAGGSAHGLAAADGVMAALTAAGVGFDTGHGRVPIVPAAILFDLDGGPHRPTADAGRAAAEAASSAPVPQGAVGAGAGARVGRGLGAPVAGGVGSAAVAVGDHVVGALVAVNAFGAIRDPDDGTWVSHPDGPAQPQVPEGDWRGNTTLAVVATDAPLDRAGCRVVAKMASAALARCCWPAFTPFDGDVVFALSTTPGAASPPEVAALGDAAAIALQAALLAPFRGR